MVITAILNVFVRKEIRRWCGVLNKDLCIGQKKTFFYFYCFVSMLKSEPKCEGEGKILRVHVWSRGIFTCAIRRRGPFLHIQ